MAQLIGLARIGRDAELRYTSNGDPVAGVSLAFNYGKKGDDGKRPTQWVDASIWGQRAESLAPHLLKGTLLNVTLDDPHIETFTKNDGGQGHKLVGKISNLEFAGRPDSAEQQTTQQRQQPARPPSPPRNDYQGAREGRPQQQSGGNFADMDDDIPF